MFTVSPLLQHVNGLVIPGGQEAYTADYSCAKRCTYVPLGGLMGKPVTIAGGRRGCALCPAYYRA